MENADLFKLALGLSDPWVVTSIDFKPEEKRLDINIDFASGSKFKCPQCDIICRLHDTEVRTWQHLNFFQYHTFLHARVPRTKCPEHGTHRVEVPWSRPQSGFTLLYEALILTLAKEMPVKSLSKIIEVTDTRIWRVIEHYVEKAVSEKSLASVTKIGIDETASQRGHNYVTVTVDLDKREAIHVAEGKGASTVKEFVEHLTTHKGDAANITDVSCDMSPAFIKGVKDNLPAAKITFDRFHVMKMLNEAVDSVRRSELKNRKVLTNTKFTWLKNPKHLSKDQKEYLNTVLLKVNLLTARAYRMKLAFQELYTVEPREAIQRLEKWISWARRSRLEPMKEFAQMLRRHWDGIVQWWQSAISNGILEGLNSLVQAAKAKARGFRTFKYLKMMIYMIVGKLDLSYHTN